MWVFFAQVVPSDLHPFGKPGASIDYSCYRTDQVVTINHRSTCIFFLLYQRKNPTIAALKLSCANPCNKDKVKLLSTGSGLFCVSNFKFEQKEKTQSSQKSLEQLTFFR